MVFLNAHNDPTPRNIALDGMIVSLGSNREQAAWVKSQVQMARICALKKLLLETHQTSTAIADRMNFNSEFYRYKFFKKHTGMTTKQFRAQVKS